MGKIEPQEEPMGKRAARLGAGNTPLERPIKEEVSKVNNNNVKCLDFTELRPYSKTVANTTAVPKSQIII